MKYRLLAPGPTQVPDRVLREMSKTIIHHRTPQFEAIFSDCQAGMAWLADSRAAPLILAASGTGAFEASVQNFFSPGDKILCVTGGKFADNWLKMARCFGLNAVEIPVVWGQAVTVEQFEAVFKSHPDCRGVVVVASETSTGVRHPYEQIAALVRERADCLMVVDAVTALGVWHIRPDQEHIDLMVAGSQKGLMLPPGLGFVWVSEKAWERQKTATLPRYYFDLAKEKKAQAARQTSYTPAVSLIMGLREALKLIGEESKARIFTRHQRLAHATRTAMSALGLKLFADTPSDAITSVVSPVELPKDAIYQGLMQMANFTIAGGQEHLNGKIFRIGHMGYVDDIDMLAVFGAVEIVLKKLGYEKFASGASIAAATPILLEGFN
jgi:aspartate aminotransferase-like enzyme